MKLHHAVIAVATTVLTAVGGGFVVAQAVRNEAPNGLNDPTRPSNTSPQATAPATTTPARTTPARTTPENTSPPENNSPPEKTSPPADELSEENLIRERLYYDVTGHSFSGVKTPSDQVLSACTGDRTFADSLPKQGVTILSSTLSGEDGREVVNQVAQTASAGEARVAADEIVTLVVNCEAIQGGDFGYGDPVTVVSNASRQVIYLPAFDSDRPSGGYIVIQVGNRVGVVDVNDGISEEQVSHLARETASITAD